MSEGDGAPKFTKPVKVVIDGREITAEAGHMLLQVALDNGVEIPHYCYHPKLSIDGSCRMCQVKIEKAPKLAIACNTPVADGMVVDTRAPEVADARKGVMELLLVNHPLDCPICDQAGECFLQDYSVGFGRGDARTRSPRRKGVKRYPIGPRVVFDQERCILCRRCVRFTKEISKSDELRVFGMGDRSRIGTSADRPLDNDYSINTADICPVGALLSSDFHHKRRVWFLSETESVCPSCSNGCNVKIGTFRDEIQRLLPRRNDAVNDTWMCDHGRLNYRFVNDATRVREPVVRGASESDGARRGNGSLPPSALDDAIAVAAERIEKAIAEHGAASVAILASAQLTNEELFRLSGLARDAIGTPNLDAIVPLGEADDILIKAEKVANGRGARDLGIAPGAGGRNAQAILDGCASGDVKLLFAIGSADLLRAFPPEQVTAALSKLETLIVQDATASALTERAVIVLPGLVWAEKDGSFTNHAGRVQRIRRALEPQSGLVSDGEIFVRLGARLRKAKPEPFDARKVLQEIAAAVPAYAGLSFEKLGSRGASSGEKDAAPVATTPAGA
jgi:NADH-quinone oxidoreductase subunit G